MALIRVAVESAPKLSEEWSVSSRIETESSIFFGPAVPSFQMPVAVMNRIINLR